MNIYINGHVDHVIAEFVDNIDRFMPVELSMLHFTEACPHDYLFYNGTVKDMSRNMKKHRVKSGGSPVHINIASIDMKIMRCYIHDRAKSTTAYKLRFWVITDTVCSYIIKTGGLVCIDNKHTRDVPVGEAMQLLPDHKVVQICSSFNREGWHSYNPSNSNDIAIAGLNSSDDIEPMFSELLDIGIVI